MIPDLLRLFGRPSMSGPARWSVSGRVVKHYLTAAMPAETTGISLAEEPAAAKPSPSSSSALGRDAVCMEERTDQEEARHLPNLPDTLLLMIAGELSCRALCALATSSQPFRVLITECDVLWEALGKRAALERPAGWRSSWRAFVVASSSLIDRIDQAGVVRPPPPKSESKVRCCGADVATSSAAVSALELRWAAYYGGHTAVTHGGHTAVTRRL